MNPKTINKVIYYILVLVVLTSCASSVIKKEKKTEYKLSEIFNTIKKKDSTSLIKMINKNNVNSFDSKGVSLLSRAVLTRANNIVKILINGGANPNLINNTSYKSTPLMMASGFKTLEIAKYLIQKGADVDIQDKNGDPAIHWSAYYGNVPFTKLMLDKQAKTNLHSIHSDGVLQVALKEWKDSVVNLLLDYNIKIYKPLSNTKELVTAVKTNNIPLFKSLINNNNLNTKDEASNTLLMIAANKGYFKIVEELITKGADIDKINSVGQTALNLAVYHNKNKTAKYLIKQGANINKADKRFILPPLVAAVRSNNLEMGKILLEKDADINTLDGINNYSPIMWATAYKYKDFVILLLKYNPDLTFISKYKQNVFDMTRDQEILKLLKEK